MDSSGIPIPHIALGVSAKEGNKRTLVLGYQDRVSISNAAKQLHLNIRGNDEGAEKTERSWERFAKGSNNKSISLMDKHISIAGNILERMKKLAEAAQDETISETDRIELQIEMGRLQHSLDFSNDLMERIFVLDFASGAEEFTYTQHGVYEDSDAYKMLERARERIANGEEWDVAEINTNIFKYAKVKTDALVFVENKWEISDDETVPSVGDILKAKGRSLMDAEAAALTAEELEKDLTALAEKRGQLIAFNFIDQNGGNPKSPEVAASLEGKLTLLEHGLMRFMQSLFREMVQTTQGRDKDEQGNPIVRPSLLDEGRSIIKTPQSEETLELNAIQRYSLKKPLEFEEYSVYA
jgi:hypothetical protein